MTSHWTAVIQIKEVIPPAPVVNDRGYPVKATGGGDMMSQRSVLDRLSLTVTADTEEEAYRKIQRMLEANMPEPVTAEPLAEVSAGTMLHGTDDGKFTA